MASHVDKFQPTITLPKGREFKGGDLLAQSLKHLGVEVAFGLHGGHLDAFLMGAHDIGIKIVDTRHETSAVQAAEGYNKVTNRVGVCFVTANSGFSNGIPGLATASADRSPILCITSSSPRRDAEANVLQGFHDQIVLAAPLTRFAHRVAHPEEIPRLVSYAWRRALAAPPGPVLLDVPIEVLFGPVQTARLSWGSLGARPAYPPAPHRDAVRAAAQLLATAERPVVVTGSGAARALRGSEAFRRFVETARLPVFASSKHSSPLPFGSALRCGDLARLGALGGGKGSGSGSGSGEDDANHDSSGPGGGARAQQDPDLVILLGARTGMFFGMRNASSLPSPTTARYVHVDVDAAEVGRMIPVDVGITADVVAAVEALAEEVEHVGYRAPEAWVERLAGLRALPLPWEGEPRASATGRMHPYHAIKTAFEALPPDSIIMVDGGEAGLWVGTAADAARPYEVISATGYLGFLGNGWGYSLGASQGDRQRLIVNVQGDGSACFHIAELDTFARLGCRILTIVLNNHCWGMSTHGQALLYGHLTDARPAASLSPSLDFAAVARATGCAGERVRAVEEIEGAVGRLVGELDGGKPALLELVVDDQPTHPGTVAMVGNTDNENEVVIPYYDNVPRPRYD